ncbi:MAG: histidinol-phosphatase [Treponemataceae bacterium]|nr:histidinol-phosphatase [Treponemataceae bacterium]
MKTNYHTHTAFCDGIGTPEEIAAAAAKKQFDILGFSSHSMHPFAGSWHIPPRAHADYAAAVRAVAETYRGQLDILCGFEADYIPGICRPSMDDYAAFRPDYLIGSVHYIVARDGHFCADDPAEGVAEGIRRHFRGDARAAVCTYFSLQREMLAGGGFAIWGHPDLIRIRNAALRLFNESDSWYRNELKATARAARKAGVIAEINTGAINRGAMDDVYPSADFLQMLHAEGVPVTVNSDAHAADQLDGAFCRAFRAAEAAGYRETAYLAADGSAALQPIGRIR